MSAADQVATAVLVRPMTDTERTRSTASLTAIVDHLHRLACLLDQTYGEAWFDRATVLRNGLARLRSDIEDAAQWDNFTWSHRPGRARKEDQEDEEDEDDIEDDGREWWR